MIPGGPLNKMVLLTEDLEGGGGGGGGGCMGTPLSSRTKIILITMTTSLTLNAALYINS